MKQFHKQCHATVQTNIFRWLGVFVSLTLIGFFLPSWPASLKLMTTVHAMAPSNIARVWANEGGDKVTRDELRATANPTAVLNSVWDGTRISLFGARNEVISFNLVLEVPSTTATSVNVSLTSLNGPSGASITTTSASGNGVFSFVGRNIELFYIRYLEIKGLSLLAYETYDERHIPARCRRPYDSDGIGTGTWNDRPCHNKFYPEIAVPLELHAPFSIPAGTNQSIWGDIYIPQNTPAGEYTGTITVTENGLATWQIPIRLRVRNFNLPDIPSGKTMVFYSQENINDRYLGVAYPDPGTSEYTQSLQLADKHFQLAHHHKISLIDGYSPISQMSEAWVARLNGSLFTPGQSYDGIGVSIGNNVYSIGTYGSWPWQGGTQSEMRSNTDAWVNWFESQSFGTSTEYFLYLIDESSNYAQIEQWATWINTHTGPGKRLMSMATIAAPTAMANTPSLDMAASTLGVGITSAWENAASNYAGKTDRRFFLYNGQRPASGSFAIEDEGVSPRVTAWAQYKKKIDRWFYWESTYYENFQGGTGQTNVFQRAQTFGGCCTFDNSLGETGWNYTNGDGVLFYPGTDTRFPSESYGVQGPFASLRMKLWRRGLQDVDYLTLAAAINPTLTAQIVNQLIPKVVWEYGVSDPSDPTWVRTDISWSINPDIWEAARAQLADLIEGTSLSVALFRVDRDSGFVYADGAYSCGLSGNSGAVAPCFNASVGADIAEYVAVTEKLEPGDLVELDPEHPTHYRKTRSAYSQTIAGIVSQNPGLLMAAGLVGNRAPLALAGRVLAKATAENGLIRPGDLLVSASRPGHAMRCPEPLQCEGAIIGKALTGLSHGTGFVLVLVIGH
jgi:hypothetical protein